MGLLGGVVGVRKRVVRVGVRGGLGVRGGRVV